MVGGSFRVEVCLTGTGLIVEVLGVKICSLQADSTAWGGFDCTAQHVGVKAFLPHCTVPAVATTLRLMPSSTDKRQHCTVRSTACIQPGCFYCGQMHCRDFDFCVNDSRTIVPQHGKVH